MTASKDKSGKFCRQLQITLPASSTIDSIALRDLFTKADQLKLYQDDMTATYTSKALRGSSTDALVFEFFEQGEVKASRKAVQPLLHKFLVDVASTL